MRAILKRFNWLGFVVGVVVALTVAVLLPKCEGPGPHPFTRAASITTIHHPPSFVFWFTQVPRRLEPMDCQLVPGLSPQFQGLRVWVCVPYFLNGYPTPDGKLPAPQRITHP